MVPVVVSIELDEVSEIIVTDVFRYVEQVTCDVSNNLVVVVHFVVLSHVVVNVVVKGREYIYLVPYIMVIMLSVALKIEVVTPV